MNFQDPFKPLNVLLFSVERPKAVTNTQSRGRGGWRTAGWGRVHPARPPRHSKGSAREELREPHSAGRGGAPERGRLGAGPRRRPPRFGAAGGAGMPGREAEVRPGRAGPSSLALPRRARGLRPGGRRGAARCAPYAAASCSVASGQRGDGGPAPAGDGGSGRSWGKDHCCLGVCPTLLLICPCFLICHDSVAPRGAETRSPLANTVMCLQNQKTSRNIKKIFTLPGLCASCLVISREVAAAAGAVLGKAA